MSFLTRIFRKRHFESGLSEQTVTVINRRLRSGMPLSRCPNPYGDGEYYINRPDGESPCPTTRVSNALVMSRQEAVDQLFASQEFATVSQAFDEVVKQGYTGIALVNIDTGDLNVLKLVNASGKKCGEGYISSDLKCRVGPEQPLEQKEQPAKLYTESDKHLDKQVAKYLYASVDKDVEPEPDGTIQCHQALAAIENRLGGLKDEKGFKSRVRLYDWDETKWKDVSKAIDLKDWPKQGPMHELVVDIKDGSVNGHSFAFIGKYAVDPYLRSKGLTHDDIQQFDRKMAALFEKAGIQPIRLKSSPPPAEPPIQAKASPKTHGIAKIGDILKGVVWKPKTSTPKAELDDLVEEDDQYNFQKDLGLYDYAQYVDFKEQEKEFTGIWAKQGKWKSAGAVAFNDKGEIAIREVAGGFGGYDWSFGKGMVEKGEDDKVAAVREVEEEMGLKGELLDDLGEHEGSSSVTQFYLMKHTGTDTSKMDKETKKVKWVKPEEAADHLHSVRDLRVLVKAMIAMQKHLKK